MLRKQPLIEGNAIEKRNKKYSTTGSASRSRGYIRLSDLSLCASLLVSENAFILEVGPLSSHEVDGVRKEKERLTASRS